MTPGRTRSRAKPALALLALAALFALGCVQRSEGIWMIRSAKTPENWPAPTPVGDVQVKRYPAYRAACTADVGAEEEGRNSMFMELFRHIQRNDIPMTAPVEMSYVDTQRDHPRLSSMAFLYGSPEVGKLGADGSVEVRDLESMLFASVGLRGSYTTKNYAKGLDALESWMRANPDWEAAGPPRYLGYNSPFVPPFLRFGEVQIPVRRVTTGS